MSVIKEMACTANKDEVTTIKVAMGDNMIVVSSKTLSSNEGQEEQHVMVATLHNIASKNFLSDTSFVQGRNRKLTLHVPALLAKSEEGNRRHVRHPV